MRDIFPGELPSFRRLQQTHPGQDAREQRDGCSELAPSLMIPCPISSPSEPFQGIWDWKLAFSQEDGVEGSSPAGQLKSTEAAPSEGAPMAEGMGLDQHSCCMLCMGMPHTQKHFVDFPIIDLCTRHELHSTSNPDPHTSVKFTPTHYTVAKVSPTNMLVAKGPKPISYSFPKMIKNEYHSTDVLLICQEV